VSDTTTLNITFTDGLGSSLEVTASMLVNFNNNSNPTMQITSFYSGNIEIDKSTI